MNQSVTYNVTLDKTLTPPMSRASHPVKGSEPFRAGAHSTNHERPLLAVTDVYQSDPKIPAFLTQLLGANTPALKASKLLHLSLIIKVNSNLRFCGNVTSGFIRLRGRGAARAKAVCAR